MFGKLVYFCTNQLVCSMKRILLGLFFLLIGNNIFAQTIGTINGVVKDKNTQEVLIGVVLKFVGKDTINTLSDDNGNFSVQLPVGKYNLETSYIGYTPFTLYNINLTSGNAQILQIELDEKSQELQEVVINAGKSVRASDMITPLATQKLTAEEIKSNPGGNFDVSKVIQVLPGVAGGTTLFFENDLDEHIDCIYGEKKWPENPLFYACCPSKTDKSVAPKGKENLFLLMPLAIGIQDDETNREKYLAEMLSRIEKHTGIADLASKIEYQRSYCVTDFVQDYNAYGGNAYGLANTLNQTAVLKPKIKNKKLNNLFYTGQLTVPGPGVPPSIISGKIVANEVTKFKN